MQIGVLAESFGLPLREAIGEAARLGMKGVQIYAVEGETAPENMDAAAIRELRTVIKDQNLVISAICADMGGGGFAFPEQNAARIERTRRIMDMALQLDCRVLTTHIGVVPTDAQHPRNAVIADALGRLGEYAQRAGAVFAIETGPEPAHVLLRMLQQVNNPAIGVNMDPANLVMSLQADPVQAVYTLKDHIVHTHAKDGVFLKWVDPDMAYGMVPPAPDYNESDYCLEVPLGQGGVDFPRYLRALQDIGYQGFLTIERETGENPARDIELAVRFLQERLEELR